MNTRTLNFESLERRILLAGDVKAELKGGDLVVTGDRNVVDANDRIEISSLGSGSYRVTGLDGTTVNGRAPGTPVDISGVTRHVKVDLKTGNNKVEILGAEGARFMVPGDLTVKTLLGSDEVRARYATVGGKVTVDVGAGNDTVTMQSLVAAKDVSIKSGDGGDVVSLSHSTLGGKLTVDTGNENDSVTIDSTTVEKDLSIKTGNGVDTATMTDVTAKGKLTVDTGNDNDTVTIDHTAVEKDLSITTGNGDDLVLLQAVTAKGKVTVDTGNGEDRVGLFDGTTVDKDASLSTGNGDDVVGLKDTTIKGNLRVTSGNQQDAVGLAGGEVFGNATLDAGNTDAVRGARDSVGLTGTRIRGDLNVRTGRGEDLVGAGNDTTLTDTIQTIFTEAFGSDLVGVILAGRVGVQGNASFSTGDGSDDIGFFGVDVTGDATVTSGKGGDELHVVDSYARRFKLDMGNDDDWASIEGGMANAVDAIMGSGIDRLALNLTEAPANVRLDGGTGEDTLDSRGHITKNDGVFVKNWELFV
jgi:hypothetical protein